MAVTSTVNKKTQSDKIFVRLCPCFHSGGDSYVVCVLVFTVGVTVMLSYCVLVFTVGVTVMLSYCVLVFKVEVTITLSVSLCSRLR